MSSQNILKQFGGCARLMTSELGWYNPGYGPGPAIDFVALYVDANQPRSPFPSARWVIDGVKMNEPPLCTLYKQSLRESQ